MIVVYPFSPVDQELALKNALWIKELGGCKGHEVLMLFDARCAEQVKHIEEALSDSFGKVHPLCAKAQIDGWPQGANYFFRFAAAWFLEKQWPFFFWMEPDAIPLKPGWFDILLVEYNKAKKPFMGDRVQVENIPLHMSGVGFYPNPLHAYAGEAYRAFEVAWDMAGREQIIPRAHFTKLIEHAWKHPAFTDVSELTTQIRPEAVIFHASKDGSLIDVLRARNAVPEKESHSVEAEPTTRETPSREEIGTLAAQPSCDIFIRTYAKDYEWLYECLRSINKFAKGFREIWIVAPDKGTAQLGILIQSLGYHWKQMNDETEDGYLAQQITKLYADVITTYQADYILHIDSDVILTRQVTPDDFLHDGKVVWPYTPYAAIQTPWQPIVEKFMDRTVENEFMRRFPIMVPRWLYPRLREFAFRSYGRTIAEYIQGQPVRAFSEFNVLGAYAWEYYHNQFHWIDTTKGLLPEPCARQFRSWEGINDQVRSEIETILRGPERTPALISDAPGTRPTSGPSQIISLPNDVWVLEGDQISKWVEESGRLDHDQNLLPHILDLIDESDIVIDVGAFIGDHTVAYAAKAKQVIAYEPNPAALTCLLHNTAKLRNVFVIQGGLSDKEELVSLSGNNGNWGGCYVGNHMPVATVQMWRLDRTLEISTPEQGVPVTPGFIKFDCEGYELKALLGAQKTIEKYHPKMVIEINRGALERQGAHPEDIYDFLKTRGYSYSVMQENCCFESPLFDIDCIHVGVSPEVPAGGNGAVVSRCSTSPPPVNIFEAVTNLAAIAAAGPKSRWAVMMALYKAGLTPRKDNKKKKRKVKRETPTEAAETSQPAAESRIAATKSKRPGRNRK